MGRIKTNLMELVLKETLIGKEIYIGDKLLKIDDINYQPLINVVFIECGGEGYKLSLNELYEFECKKSDIKRIFPNMGKLKSKK